MTLNGVSQGFLADLGRLQQRADEASRQISSGKRIATASDDPDSVEPLLQLRAESARNAQIRSNLSLAQMELEPADRALTEAIKLMDRARVLGAAGATETLGQSQRDSLAAELQSIQEQMVSLSRTSVQGRFLFSGDRDDSPAYVVDLTADHGVAELAAATAEASRRIEDPAGGSFASRMTARQIFDSRNADDTLASDNVFAALNEMRLALTGGDTDAVADAVSSIQQASKRLGDAQSFYGSTANRIGQAQSYSSALGIRLTTSLSEVEDADAAAAALELTQANLQIQTAFEMRSNLSNRSLFDYLG